MEFREIDFEKILVDNEQIVLKGAQKEIRELLFALRDDYSSMKELIRLNNENTRDENLIETLTFGFYENPISIQPYDSDQFRFFAELLDVTHK